MAQAIATKKTVTESVTLNLTPEEAQAIRTLAGSATGDSINGRRKHADSVWNALDSAGVESYDWTTYSGIVNLDKNRY